MNASPVGRPDGSRRYEIRLKGRLDPRWAAWFDGMALSSDDGTTVLSGLLADQAALHGVLQKVRDLGLPLLSVTPLEEPPHDSTTHPASSGREAT
jgi:hypothetical protein